MAKIMSGKAKFLQVYYLLPEAARGLLVLNYYERNPMSLNVIALEVRADTLYGEKLLKKLGFIKEKED